MAKILLADDSTHAQRMGAKILAAEGHKVVTASNGQAAITMLQEFAPDLVVADVFMPGKTGYEVCEFLKSNPALSHIPVLLIVGAMEPFDPGEGRRVRADGVITKPLESSDFVATIRKLLASVKKPTPPPKKPAAVPVASPQSSEAEEIYPTEEVTAMMEMPLAMEIPEEIGQQPISLFGDLLEPPAATVEDRLTEEVVLTESSPLEEISLEGSEPIALDAHPPAVGREGWEAEPPLPVVEVSPESAPSLVGELEGVEALEPAESPSSQFLIPQPEASPAPVWSAEPAAVTEEDKKLFESRDSDWEGLMKMVEEENEEPPSPLPAVAGLASYPVPPGEAGAISPGLPESESGDSGLPPEAASEEETPRPRIAPLDRATIEQLVREAVEEIMPQIVERIVQTTGIPLQKDE